MRTVATSTKTCLHATDSISELCREHAGYVLNLMTHLIGPGEDAKDLAQEVFVIAIRHTPTTDELRSPREWFAAIAVRVVAHARRTRWFSGLFGASETPESLVDWRTPDRYLMEKEESKHLYAMLDKLTEKKRMVFILHDIMGMSAPEIARVVNCPINTVYARLRHARAEVFAHNRRSTEPL